jgi:hypothetical protein
MKSEIGLEAMRGAKMNLSKIARLYHKKPQDTHAMLPISLFFPIYSGFRYNIIIIIIMA